MAFWLPPLLRYFPSISLAGVALVASSGRKKYVSSQSSESLGKGSLSGPQVEPCEKPLVHQILKRIKTLDAGPQVYP